MADEIRWGRVGEATTKQKALLARANDCCGGSINWYRHPAWTEAMRAALGTCRATGGKWFSLIDRMYDLRLMGAACLTDSLRGYRQFWSMIHALRLNPAPCSGEPCAGKPPARFGGRGG